MGLMDLNLAGKTVLITGSYRGTGAGIAEVFAGEGATVLVHGFEPGQPDEVVEALTAGGGSAAGVVADITTDEGAATLADAAATVDVVVNNYGTPMKSGWESMDNWAEEWNRNVMAGVRVTQLCTPGMTERGWGRVVFVGTVGSKRPGAKNPGYYAAKAGLHAMVRTLAMDLRGTGVTANLVSPAMIATAEVREGLTKRAARAGAGDSWDDIQKWGLENVYANLNERIADPIDIGNVVAFVASEPAWHINGADIAVDGGAVDAVRSAH